MDAGCLVLLLVVLSAVCADSAALETHSNTQGPRGLNLGGVLGPLVDQVGQILTGTVNGTLGTAANITGWTGANTTAPTNPCTWTGITCNALGNITGLVLDGLALTGAIPSGLDALANLTTLDLSDNNYNGTIPDLSGFTSLLNLDLSGNDLTGAIPSLANLTQLLHLDLSGNLLNGTIPSLDNLTSLLTLDLSNNALEGVIPSLSSLISLISLDLSNNALTGSIADLSALTSLEYLDLSNNNLEGTIPDLSALRSLRYINLSGNNLTGEFPDLSQLSNLTTLIVSDNLELFVLGIPATLIDGLTSLTTLVLDNTGATGLLPNFVLGALQTLSIENNLLCGALPSVLSQPVAGLNFAAGCNCFFESWCSANNGPCSNFVANNSAACDTSRCASVGCLIPTPSSPTGSILKFVNNLPNFLWEHPAPSAQAGSDVTLQVGLVSLIEIDELGAVIHTEPFPAGGSYSISVNASVRSNGATVDEITFRATLANGAEVAIAYVLSPDSAFTQPWGEIAVTVPRNHLKYTFNARRWPFAGAAHRLRLAMSLTSHPLVGSADRVDDAAAATSSLSLHVTNSTADVSVGLYGFALVYSAQEADDSLTAPTGAHRSANVTASLSADFGSILVDFPSFDAATEVLSYDPSFGVLYGGVNTRDDGQGGSSDGNTWVIAVAVAVPVAIVVVLVAVVAVFGVAWWRHRSYDRRSRIYRGSMINVGPDEGL